MVDIKPYGGFQKRLFLVLATTNGKGNNDDERKTKRTDVALHGKFLLTWKIRIKLPYFGNKDF